MTLWMYVTDDELELPIIVVETVQELADLVGTTPGNIYSSYSKYKKGVRKTSRNRGVTMAKCKNCKHLKIDSSIEKKICFLIGEIGNPDEEISCCCFRPATNADRIRSMTDEQLAHYLEGFAYGGMKVDANKILKWLKSEVGCE